MSRWRLMSLLVVLLLSLSVMPALAGGNGAVSITETEHNATDQFTDVVPCLEDLGSFDITLTYNAVEHATFGPNSAHFTFTQTGTFVAVSTAPDGPTVTGHVAIWGGFNENSRNASGTFTFNLHGTTDDGTMVTFNGVEHFSVSATGIENEFVLENCH
jgi:hypothetical protein